MGRHRSDPRERLRYAAAVVLVLTVVVLLAVGGFVLYGTLKPKTMGNVKGTGRALSSQVRLTVPAPAEGFRRL